jgi:hypothetical protein
VQLVFREGDKNWLCISSKLSNAKLAIGQKYKIEGMFKQVGERTYIHEPKIELSKRHIPVKRLSIVAGAITALVTVGGVAFATHNGGTQPQPASHPAAQVVATQPTSTAGTTEQTPPVATTPPATTTTPATTAAKTITKPAAKSSPKPASTGGGTNTSASSGSTVSQPDTPSQPAGSTTGTGDQSGSGGSTTGGQDQGTGTGGTGDTGSGQDTGAGGGSPPSGSDQPPAGDNTNG